MSLEEKGPRCAVCEARGPYDASFRTGYGSGESWCCSKDCVATLSQMRATGPQLPTPATSLARLPGEVVLRLIAAALAGPWRVEPHGGWWRVQHADTREVAQTNPRQDPCVLVAERLNAWEATRGL